MIKYNSKKSMITKFKYKESAPPGQCYVMSYSLCQSIIESLLHKHKRHVLNVIFTNWQLCALSWDCMMKFKIIEC
jgi:hypothetical protein